MDSRHRGSRPRTFIPQRFYYLVIKNKSYGILREKPNWEGFQDIPNVDDDANNVKQGLRLLGADLTEIKTYEDISYEKLHKVKNKLKQKIVQNKIDGYNTLCFVYYAGHGVMDNMTYAVCNQAN